MTTEVKHLCIIEKESKPDRACVKSATAVEIDRHILFDPNTVDALDEKGCKPFHYDLLVLCAAIEFADRHWQRPQDWSRSFHLTVPVFDLGIWQKPEVTSALKAVLSHLTCDDWAFKFVQAKNSSPFNSRQIPINFGRRETFAIAYSNGLDSRAVTALVGSNQALCIRIANTRQCRENSDSFFTQVPFKVEGHASNESSFRSRGFQFAAVTALAAHIAGLSRIVVPESGQGALGPVLLPLHQTYEDYRSHPTFFRKMEAFLYQVLNYQVTFEQPRIWFTKGQTMQAFLKLQDKTGADLVTTRSCWQKQWVNANSARKQCGLCAACVFRRFSLHAAGVDEPPDVYLVQNLTTNSVNEALADIAQETNRDRMIQYGSAGVRHFDRLAQMASAPDVALRVHAYEIAAATNSTYPETIQKLRTLLMAHSEEWRTFLSAQGERSFLKTWIDGGRQ